MRVLSSEDPKDTLPKRMKVYLIDDDQAVVSALKLLLQTVGMEAVTFTDPQSFLNQLPSPSHGCIVLDIRMPTFPVCGCRSGWLSRVVTGRVIIITGHGDIDACRRHSKVWRSRFSKQTH